MCFILFNLNLQLRSSLRNPTEGVPAPERCIHILYICFSMLYERVSQMVLPFKDYIKILVPIFYNFEFIKFVLLILPRGCPFMSDRIIMQFFQIHLFSILQG